MPTAIWNSQSDQLNDNFNNTVRNSNELLVFSYLRYNHDADVAQLLQTITVTRLSPSLTLSLTLTCPHSPPPPSCTWHSRGTESWHWVTVPLLALVGDGVRVCVRVSSCASTAHGVEGRLASVPVRAACLGLLREETMHLDCG